jgi:hypothetical protein
MPFEMIQKKTPPARQPMHGVSVRVYRYKGALYTRFNISQAVASELGIKRGQRIGVAVGNGEHDGMVALIPNHEGGLLVQRAYNAKAYNLVTGRVPNKHETPGTVSTQYTINDGVLLVTMPRVSVDKAPRPAAPAGFHFAAE